MPYWSRVLMAFDQLSSIFWNSANSGAAVDVTAEAAGAEAVGAVWEDAEIAINANRAEKQKAKRAISDSNSPLPMISLGLPLPGGRKQRRVAVGLGQCQLDGTRVGP